MKWKGKLKEKMEKFMSSKNILACDIGLKRIGLATQIQGILFPLKPILRKNRNQAAKELTDLLEQREISILVVGIPLLDTNETHEMERRIRHFVSLIDFYGEIVYINEALSSKIAHESLMDLTTKERKEKIKNGDLDSFAAIEILKRYLSK